MNIIIFNLYPFLYCINIYPHESDMIILINIVSSNVKKKITLTILLPKLLQKYVIDTHKLGILDMNIVFEMGNST